MAGDSAITTQSTAGRQISLLIGSVFLESIRRREFYVLLLFMGLFLVGALVARMVHVENAPTATFLLNLGLTLAFSFSKLITLLTAARQFPDELEQRTLYPLLAKPLGRGQYILGKWASSVLIGLLTLATLFMMAWLPVPKLEQYSGACMTQMLLLEAFSICMLASLALLLSLLLPKTLNVVVLVVLVITGGRIAALIRNRFYEAPWGEFVRWFLGYIPDFGRLDLLLRYTDGLPSISSLDLLLRILYAIGFTAFPLALSAWLLHRKQL
jgi:ABC-type transport system involved in multi-copper enzyme maturation permease subunit